MSVPIASEVVNQLLARKEKLVLAESCTGGMVSALISQVPNASQIFCGSFVTYRSQSKMDWLHVPRNLIEEYTTESAECAKAMVMSALNDCVEADWAASIVGHFGPNAPLDKDGKIWICIGKRDHRGDRCIVQESMHQLPGKDRVARQRYAAEYVVSYLARCLLATPYRRVS